MMRVVRPWAVVVLVLLIAGGVWAWAQRSEQQPIRIGVLHSLSGPMARYERPIVDAVQFAVDEINQSGGLLGRPVEAVLADCRSEAAHCAREAERLISEVHVSVLFGCGEVSCRKAVTPIVERHRHLLFYPLHYEGMDQSPNVVYLGATPNQQLIPAIRWALDTLGRRFYLIGSDDMFSRTANLIIRDIIAAQGGEVLGERYLAAKAEARLHGIGAAIEELRSTRPDVVINSINGDINHTFFGALLGMGLNEKQLPVVSMDFDENTLQTMPAGAMAGHYAVQSYFQALPGSINQRFVAAFRKHFGADRVISDPMEVAYVGVKLWAQAVQEAGTEQPAQIGITSLRQSMAAPEGIVSVDKENHHLWRNAHVGRARADGQFDVIWSSNAPIRPQPYPSYRTIADWQQRLKKAGLR